MRRGGGGQKRGQHEGARAHKSVELSPRCTGAPGHRERRCIKHGAGFAHQDAGAGASCELFFRLAARPSTRPGGRMRRTRVSVELCGAAGHVRTLVAAEVDGCVH